MKPPSSKSQPAIGFLTVVASGDAQLTGGYLLVDASGRPLEFHCTVPVKASRAQEILYGATLEPFLYGEQIAATLIRKPKISPVVVCTDCSQALTARSVVNMPVLLVGDARDTKTRIKCFSLASHEVALAEQDADDRVAVEKAFASIHIEFDLAEPFDRIRGAIEEAQRQAA